MFTSVETWLWLAAGIALVCSELVATHLVSGFLGAGALVVAALRLAGVLQGTVPSLIVWAVASAGLLVLLRQWLVKVAGKPEKQRASLSEELRTFGREVEVVETVVEGAATGRVRFDGTTWPAQSVRGTIEAGGKARLVHRENLAWVVEPSFGAAALPKGGG